MGENFCAGYSSKYEVRDAIVSGMPSLFGNPLDPVHLTLSFGFQERCEKLRETATASVAIKDKTTSRRSLPN